MYHIQSRPAIDAFVETLQIFDPRLLGAGRNRNASAITEFENSIDERNAEMILSHSLSIPNALEYIISGQIPSSLARLS